MWEKEDAEGIHIRMISKRILRFMMIKEGGLGPVKLGNNDGDYDDKEDTKT